MPTITDPTVAAATEAVESLLELDPTASPQALAGAVLASLPIAEVEAATLYELRLDHVDREHAVFSAAGGFSLTMHRGEWMERERPARIWITVQEALTAP